MTDGEKKMNEEIRRTPLAVRLDQARDMIGLMCKEGRPPAMTIPPRPEDEDVFIDLALLDAAEQLEFENLRDRFAMACLTGLMADSKCELDFADAAPMAYRCADAMMAARNA